jgi:chromosomal replication initiator protein
VIDFTVNFISSTSDIEAFPLERPLLRQRSRYARSTAAGRAGVVDHGFLIPYFICGSENRLAAYVCRSEAMVALSQPVLMIGPSGCGKSALALHLAATLAASSGNGSDVAAVKYLSATDFARQYAEAVAADDLPPLREALDQAPILVVDDLHTIAGKLAAQDELAIRIDKRAAAGVATILTSRRLPSEVRGVRPQLASRAVTGLTIALQYPDADSRAVILRELALGQGLEFSDELLGLLNAGLNPALSVPALQAAIRQVDLYCRMNQCGVGVPAIQSAINAAGQRHEVDLGKITRTVAKIWGHRTKDLRSGSRKQSVVRARSLAMLLARRLTSHSLDKIGQHFGGRDHSTVLHAIRKTESLLAEDDDLHRMWREASEKLAV